MLIAGLVGLAVGVVAGLLLAPKPGQQMREQLKGKLDEIKEKASELQAKVGEKIEQIKEQAAAGHDTPTEPPTGQDA